MLGGKPVADIHELWPVELVLRESSGPAPLF
jgi:LacI family transcriptional regulator